MAFSSTTSGETKQTFLFNFDRVRSSSGVGLIKSAFNLRGGVSNELPRHGAAASKPQRC